MPPVPTPPGLHVLDQPPDDDAGEDGTGDAPLVVLVHGTLDRSSSFVKVAALLDDLHVVVYDRRGYGRSRDALSDGGSPTGTFTGHMDDLLAVLDGRRAVVVGHSYGGVVSLGAAVRRPDLVAAVGAYEAPMPWMPWYPGDTAGGRALEAALQGSPADAAEAFMRRMIGDDGWERLPGRTQGERRAEGPALLADMRSLREAGVPFDPADVQVPVVVGHGSLSPEHLRVAAERMAAALPDAELIELPGADHGAHLGQAAGFAGLVRRAVARLT